MGNKAITNREPFLEKQSGGPFGERGDTKKKRKKKKRKKTELGGVPRSIGRSTKVEGREGKIKRSGIKRSTTR